MNIAKTPAIALIGCGMWGKNIARNLAQLGALKVIVDADAVRGGAMAKDLDAEFFTDLDAVLARADIAGVAIATPAITHADVVTKALNAGLQAALTGAKSPADAMKDAQREADRILKDYR